MSQELERALAQAQRWLQAGQPGRALPDLRRLCANAPQDGRAWYLLAAALRDSGQSPAALDAATRAAELLPREAGARYLLAQVLEDLGKPLEAIAQLRVALRLHPAYPEAHHYLGLLLADQGESAAALESFGQALRHRPSYARAWHNFGCLLRDLGRHAEAERALREAVRCDPDYALAFYNLGLLQRDHGDRRSALSSLRRAHQLQPGRVDTALALGNLLRSDGDLDGALVVFQGALVHEPAGESRVGLALAYCQAERGEIEAARASYRAAAQRSPASLRAAIGEALTLPPVYMCAADIIAERERYSAALERLLADSSRWATLPRDQVLSALSWSNFYLAYHGLDDRALQARYGDFVLGLLRQVAPEWLVAPVARQGARLRIGFASSFFTDSTAGNYFVRWITSLDRGRFEVYAYHLRPGDNPVAKAVAARAEGFRALGGKRIAEIVNAIRDDCLDILVYPELGMDGTTFLLAALRLARVQCAGWGHPVTSGHANVDVFFSAAAMEPPGAQAHYRERLLRLPGIGTSYPRPPAPSSMARKALGLPEGGELLLLPQSLFKVHPDNDALLARILAARPQARLVMFTGRHAAITAACRARIESALREAGATVADRLVILPYVPRERYLQINQACDLMLDTLHWSGGNTSLDAIASELPIVTLPGAFMRGRQSAAMLEIVGVPELVAANEEAYFGLAMRLLDRPEERQALARRLAAGASQLFDDPAPLVSLADALQALAGEASS